MEAVAVMVAFDCAALFCLFGEATTPVAASASKRETMVGRMMEV